MSAGFWWFYLEADAEEYAGNSDGLRLGFVVRVMIREYAEDGGTFQSLEVLMFHGTTVPQNLGGGKNIRTFSNVRYRFCPINNRCSNNSCYLGMTVRVARYQLPHPPTSIWKPAHKPQTYGAAGISYVFFYLQRHSAPPVIQKRRFLPVSWKEQLEEPWNWGLIINNGDCS